MKLFVALFFLATSSLFATDLQTLWSQAIHSPGENSIQDWQNWIQEAEKNGVASPEAYFNLAHAYWSRNDITPAVLNLLMSAQLRTNPFGILSDLNLIGKIQRALLDAPSPIDSPTTKTFFVFNENIKFLGELSLIWILFLIIFCRLGFVPPKRMSFSLGILALVIAISGFLLDMTQKDIRLPVILNHQGGLVPVYRTTDKPDEKPVMELPSGLLVTPELENETWIKIAKPTTGWIKKEMQLPFPLVTLNSSSKHGVY